MLEYSSAHPPSALDSTVLKLALWFHDVVYNPRAQEKGQNERESASYFKAFFSEHKEALVEGEHEQSVEDSVNHIILATINHEVPAEVSDPN